MKILYMMRRLWEEVGTKIALGGGNYLNIKFWKDKVLISVKQITFIKHFINIL